jgi:hypothetical protein
MHAHAGEPRFSSSPTLVLAGSRGRRSGFLRDGRRSTRSIRLSNPSDCNCRGTSGRHTRQTRRADRSPDPGSHELTKGVMVDCACRLSGRDCPCSGEASRGWVRSLAYGNSLSPVCEIRCPSGLFVIASAGWRISTRWNHDRSRQENGQCSTEERHRPWSRQSGCGRRGRNAVLTG